MADEYGWWWVVVEPSRPARYFFANRGDTTIARAVWTAAGPRGKAGGSPREWWVAFFASDNDFAAVREENYGISAEWKGQRTQCQIKHSRAMLNSLIMPSLLLLRAVVLSSTTRR